MEPMAADNRTHFVHLVSPKTITAKSIRTGCANRAIVERQAKIIKTITVVSSDGITAEKLICSVAKSELEDEKWSVDESKYEDIASKDWAYDVGAGSKVAKLSKVDLDKTLDKLPTIVKNSKYKGLSDEQIKKKFYDDLGIKSGDTFIDKVGDPTVIDDALFTSGGFGKVTKKDRHLYVEEFAKLISDPDEIYLEKESLRNASENYAEFDKRILKKFIRYYKDEKGNKRALIALFEYLKDKTQGVSLYFLDRDATVEKKRIEKLIYQKETNQGGEK